MSKNLFMRIGVSFLSLTGLWAADSTNARAQAEEARKQNLQVGLFDGVVPQFVDGDSWQSSLVLANLVTSTVHYEIFVSNDAGAPQAFDIVGLGKVTSVRGQLTAGQSIEYRTAGTATVLTQGYTRMFNFDRPPDQVGAQVVESRIGGYAIFRRKLPGLPDQEAVVPFADPFEKAFYIPFDNRDGFLSGVAIVNDTTQTGTLVTTVRDTAGNILASESVSMPSRSKFVYLVKDRFAATAGKNGTIHFSISSIGLSGLGLRFNPTGSFTSTHPLSY